MSADLAGPAHPWAVSAEMTELRRVMAVLRREAHLGPLRATGCRQIPQRPLRIALDSFRQLGFLEAIGRKVATIWCLHRRRVLEHQAKT